MQANVSPPDSFCFSSSASPVTAMHRWWGESPTYVLLHLKSVLMARKAYILFPNEANHSGGFAPHSLNPSPYATASGNRRMHITVAEAGLVTSVSRTKTQFWILWTTRTRIMSKQDFFFSPPLLCKKVMAILKVEVASLFLRKHVWNQEYMGM